jgi:hypothetical protein
MSTKGRQEQVLSGGCRSNPGDQLDTKILPRAAFFRRVGGPTMKKARLFVCLFLLSFLFFPDRSPAHRDDASQELGARIKRVENGLIPSPGIVVKGQPPGKAGLTERMKTYRVSGVSIAVINGNDIEWEEGYGFPESGGTSPVTPLHCSRPPRSASLWPLQALYYVEGHPRPGRNINLRLRSGKSPKTLDERGITSVDC